MTPFVVEKIKMFVVEIVEIDETLSRLRNV